MIILARWKTGKAGPKSFGKRKMKGLQYIVDYTNQKEGIDKVTMEEEYDGAAGSITANSKNSENFTT